jgi:hypothetical protein
MNGDLTTLANYKTWAAVTSTASDIMLSRLISASSQFIINWINKDIQLRSYVERRNGNGHDTLVLRNWPIKQVNSVKISGQEIPLSDGTSSGYLADENNIYLINYSFTKGIQNIAVDYAAGAWQLDVVKVPTGAQITSSDLSRVWSTDFSISFTSNGVSLTKVKTTPAASGEYTVSNLGVYKFHASDVGKDLNITYGTSPYDVEQACIELVANRAKEKERIGIASKSVANESVSFSQKDMSESTRSVLQQYKNVIPV